VHEDVEGASREEKTPTGVVVNAFARHPQVSSSMLLPVIHEQTLMLHTIDIHVPISYNA
jgi:hypothetical protein